MVHFSKSNAVTLSLVIFSIFTSIIYGGESENTTIIEACEDRNITIGERLGLRISTGNSKTRNEIMCEENRSIQKLSSAVDSNYFHTTKSDRDFRHGFPDINTSKSSNTIEMDRLNERAVSGLKEASGIGHSTEIGPRPLPGYRIISLD